MSEKRLYFGTDGVRAVANIHPMTPEFVLRLGQAAAVVLGAQVEGGERPRCVLGRDTRASGEMFEATLIAGLNSAGVDVILAGVVPTPAVAMLTAKIGANFGVIVSASHNPFKDNGIKFVHGNGRKLNDKTEIAIEKIVLGEAAEAPRLALDMNAVARSLGRGGAGHKDQRGQGLSQSSHHRSPPLNASLVLPSRQPALRSRSARPRLIWIWAALSASR